MKFSEAIYHYFLPHESNNFKAKFLHNFSLVFLASAVVFFQIVLQILPASSVKILGYAANISPDEIIRLTNEERAKMGLPPLEANSVLSQAALAKGTDMLNKDYWAHVAPDGTEPWKFFVDFGYKYRFAGENLARDFSNPSDVVRAWMASPTHRDNILSPKYKEIGVAVIEGDLAGVDTTLVIQFFGTKLSYEPEIVPVAAATGLVKAVATPTPHPGLSSSWEPKEFYVATSTIPKVSPFDLSRLASLGIVSFLIILLLIDVYVVSKQQIKRVGGKVFAHIAFLGMILAVLFIIKRGHII